MIILMFADKEPETFTAGRIVNNGMLINCRENQRGQEQIQSNRTSNMEHIRHIAKTKTKQINNNEN
jgi:hypothetical protein